MSRVRVAPASTGLTVVIGLLVELITSRAATAKTTIIVIALRVMILGKSSSHTNYIGTINLHHLNNSSINNSNKSNENSNHTRNHNNSINSNSYSNRHKCSINRKRNVGSNTCNSRMHSSNKCNGSGTLVNA